MRLLLEIFDADDEDINKALFPTFTAKSTGCAAAL
jgi:hypothetical protein